jgi:hypothetical protein
VPRRLAVKGHPPAAGDANRRGNLNHCIRGLKSGSISLSPRNQKRAAKWCSKQLQHQVHNLFIHHPPPAPLLLRQNKPQPAHRSHAPPRPNSSEIPPYKNSFFGQAHEIAKAIYDNQSIQDEITKHWTTGAVAFVPQVKSDNIGRFVFENYNSLSKWQDQSKLHSHITAYFALLMSNTPWALNSKSTGNSGQSESLMLQQTTHAAVESITDH